MRRGGRALAFLFAVGGCSALFFSCWFAKTGPVPPPAQPLSAKAPAHKTHARPAISYSIAEFTPLLALEALKPAALAVEKKQYRVAAGAVEQAMRQADLAPHEVVRWQFLLARLREKAGDLSGAAASYDLAAERQWPLVAYARLGAGRVLVRLGRHDEALGRLRQVPKDLPVSQAARLLIAETAVHLENHDLAIITWRAHLDGSKPAADEPTIALSLAEALLERGVPSPGSGEASLQAKADTGSIRQSDVIEALRMARRAATRGANLADLVTRARELEERALNSLPANERARHAELSPEDRLHALRLLTEARRFAEAEQTAEALRSVLPQRARWTAMGCESDLLRAKALAGQKHWGRAVDSLADPLKFCTDRELLPRLLYLAGLYAAADARDAQAVRHYERLEKDFATSNLADDARLNAARSYLKLGSEARFTELLSRMPDDYPNGDMWLDGVFQLALRRIQKDDWSGAAAVLDRAARLAITEDRARGHEFSGRERYFRARAWIQSGEPARGYEALEAIVHELPLSYYMLHAYSRLAEHDAARAERAWKAARARSEQRPFSFTRRPEYELPGFKRAMELLAVGEIDAARLELSELGLLRKEAAPSVLWGVALLYERAGAPQHSHAILRGLLTDWLEHYPAGNWVQAWQLAFPTPYDALVLREAKKNGIWPSLAYAVMREESAFDATAHSPADAFGLMQLIVPTAEQVAKPLGLPYDAEALKRPAVNIPLGCSYLGKLERRFADNPLLAVPAYNAGPGRPQRWLREQPGVDFDVWVELIPIRETQRYTRRVLASRAAYAVLYAPDFAERAMRLPARLSHEAK